MIVIYSQPLQQKIWPKIEIYIYLELKVVCVFSPLQSILCLGLKWLLVFVYVTQPSMGFVASCCC